MTSRTIALMLTSFFVAAMVTACGRGPQPDPLSAIQVARTSQEEKAAFTWLATSEETYAITPLDRAGAQLDLSRLEWQAKLHEIHLSVQGRGIRHQVIDPDNIFILMAE